MGLKDLPTFLPLNNPLNVGQDTSSIDLMGIQGCQFFRNESATNQRVPPCETQKNNCH